jgi:outer membrane protein assembly factor BamB
VKAHQKHGSWVSGILILSLFFSMSIIFSSCSPKPYSPPERTDWAPDGPRSLPYIGDASDPAGGDVLGNPAGFFRNMHGDGLNSDEVAIAAAPVFEQDWVAEPNTFNPTGATFDKSGNLYFAPRFSPEEDVILISLNPDDGSRRWAITGVPTALCAPLILDDPDNPGEQIIYLGSYDRAVAVKPDADANLDKVVESGEMVWDVATGLTATPGEAPPVYGLNYDPTTDTLIGLAEDNHIYVLDRKSGSLLLSSPYSLPNIAPSPANDPIDIPEFLGKRLEQVAKPLVGEMSYEDIFDTALGNRRMVANFFSVDPHTGKLWVAATAPDGEDGAEDGVSELGALYCLKLVSTGGGLLTVDNLFHTSFVGGTASTPALSADGQRVYVGDNFGKLLAIDASDGSIIWELDVGQQIVGSISVASDNRELYCPTATTIIKVIDNGTSATESWRATFDMYPKTGNSVNVNMLTASICANGIAFQAGSATLLQDRLPLIISLGCGLLDRETGKIRYFTEGREESVGITSIGPDGSIYIDHSPIRRLFSSTLYGGLVPPITGGIQKFSAKRLDLLARDAVHAAAGRANNVAVNGGSWSNELKDVEVKQIGMLIDQCRTASVKAISDGDLTAAQWEAIEGYLNNAESALATLDFTAAHQALQNADNLL